MYRIAILGCENTHADSFISLLKDGNYPDMQVVSVYSDNQEAMEKLREKYGVEIMSDYSQMQGKVDAVMITARHGDNHYKYAKPYLDDGIPMFVDKPITCTVEDAVAFMREAKEKNVRLCGGSTCAGTAEAMELAKLVSDGECGVIYGGSIAMPYYPNSPYGGFLFYAQHLVETMTTVFGNNVQRVAAEPKNGVVTVKFYYPDFSVFGTYVDNLHYYSVSIYGKNGNYSKELTINRESFLHELEQMHRLLVGNEMEKSYNDFINPVFIMNAILRSLQSSEVEEVNVTVI